MKIRKQLFLFLFLLAAKNQRRTNCFLSKEKKKIQSVEGKPKPIHISTQQTSK